MQMGVPVSKGEDVRSRCDRRRFVIQTGAVVGMGAVGLLMGRRAGAADLPHLTSADAAAKPLHYTEDASKIDRASNPAYSPGSKCANCSFFRGKAPFGSCSFFPGKAVNANGWCSAYARPDDSW
jgi:hypothetical protein